MVSDIGIGDDVHGASIAVRHEGEEDAVEELLRNRSVVERVRSNGLVGVMRVKLGVDALDRGDVVRVGGRGHGAPPLVGDLPGGEDADVAVVRVVVDLMRQVSCCWYCQVEVDLRS